MHPSKILLCVAAFSPLASAAPAKNNAEKGGHFLFGIDVDKLEGFTPAQYKKLYTNPCMNRKYPSPCHCDEGKHQITPLLCNDQDKKGPIPTCDSCEKNVEEVSKMSSK